MFFKFFVIFLKCVILLFFYVINFKYFILFMYLVVSNIYGFMVERNYKDYQFYFKSVYYEDVYGNKFVNVLFLFFKDKNIECQNYVYLY